MFTSRLDYSRREGGEGNGDTLSKLIKRPRDVKREQGALRPEEKEKKEEKKKKQQQQQIRAKLSHLFKLGPLGGGRTEQDHTRSLRSHEFMLRKGLLLLLN